MVRKCLLYRENAKPSLGRFSSHKRCVLRGNCKASRTADATDLSYGFRSSKSLRFPPGVEFGKRGLCSVKSRVSHFDFVTPSGGTKETSQGRRPGKPSLSSPASSKGRRNLDGEPANRFTGQLPAAAGPANLPAQSSKRRKSRAGPQTFFSH
jgi:hypothetical protein